MDATPGIPGIPSSKLGTNSSHGTLPMSFGNAEYIEYTQEWPFQLYNSSTDYASYTAGYTFRAEKKTFI